MGTANQWLAGILVCTAASTATELRAQEHVTPTKPAHERTAPDQNGGGKRPTHAPQPSLRALFAWNFVMKGNVACVATRREKARLQSNKLAQPVVTKSHHDASKHDHGHATTKPVRPAGAGKYVCCVVTCADGGEAIAPLLGLTRKDVLELRLAGPFVTAEAIALIERAIEKHRLSLVLVLTHDGCDALKHSGKSPEDALDRRVAAVRGLARRSQQTLAQAIGKRQRELMLVSSKVMQNRIKTDLLRIVPGVIHERTGAISWQHKRIQELPVTPVK